MKKEDFLHIDQIIPVGEIKQELEDHGLYSKKQEDPQVSTDRISEKDLMGMHAEELKKQGIEASWQVGYATQIETPDWVVTVVDQRDIGRRIVTSHKNPESLTRLTNFRELGELARFLPSDIRAIQRALSLPTFGSDDGLQATRELIEYNHRFDPIPLSNPPSPAMLCIQELKDRMAE